MICLLNSRTAGHNRHIYEEQLTQLESKGAHDSPEAQKLRKAIADSTRVASATSLWAMWRENRIQAPQESLAKKEDPISPKE